jgi:hypothetical protein
MDGVVRVRHNQLTGLLVTLAGLSSAGADAQSRPAEWSIAANPVFDTRRARTGDAVLINAVDAVRLPDGSVVVGDDGAKNLKWFAADGRVIRTVGREGDGPGEFRLVDVVGHCGGRSVFVYDGVNQRLTEVANDGRPVSTRPFQATRASGATASAVECGHANRLAVLGWPTGPIPSNEAAFRGRVTLTLQSIDGQELTDLGTFPSSERQRLGNNAGPRPLGKRTTIVTGKSRVYVGTGEGAIAVFSMQGKRLPDVQVPFAPLSITSRDIAQYVEEIVARNPRVAPSSLRETYGSLPYPSLFPAHGALLADDEDRLWVERYRRPGDQRSVWHVIGTDGQIVAEIMLPPRFRARQIVSNHILGFESDDDDVVHAVMYRINRTRR